MCNQMDDQGLASRFDMYCRYKSFGHNDFTAKIVMYYTGAQGLLLLMGVKFLIDDQASKHCSFCLNDLLSGHLYHNF